MNFPQLILITGLRVYRWLLSPAKTALFGPLGRCRFTPSCSAYALDAVRLHGAFHGSWLASKRLLRCHPWGGCGFDPVPPVRQQYTTHSRTMLYAGLLQLSRRSPVPPPPLTPGKTSEAASWTGNH